MLDRTEIEFVTAFCADEQLEIDRLVTLLIEAAIDNRDWQSAIMAASLRRYSNLTKEELEPFKKWFKGFWGRSLPKQRVQKKYKSPHQNQECLIEKALKDGSIVDYANAIAFNPKRKARSEELEQILEAMPRR